MKNAAHEVHAAPRKQEGKKLPGEKRGEIVLKAKGERYALAKKMKLQKDSHSDSGQGFRLLIGGGLKQPHIRTWPARGVSTPKRKW